MQTYGLEALAMVNDNIVKTIEATHSAKPTIMKPKASLVPPTPKPGYGPTYLPTWCSVGETCDGVVCAVTINQQGKYLPPQQRSPVVWDSNLARWTNGSS